MCPMESTNSEISTKPSIKKRGRPPGSGRKALKKWQPKSWEPIYETIVSLSSSGRTNKYIAEVTGYDPQQVSNILTCDMGLQRKAAIVSGIRSTLASSLGERIQQVTDLTVGRAFTLLSNDEYFQKNPVAVINTGLALTRTLNPAANEARKPAESGNTQINNGTIVTINSTDAKDLIAGLKKLEEIKQLHGPRE